MTIRQSRVATLVAALVIGGAIAGFELELLHGRAASAAPTGVKLKSVARAQLCVTEGAVAELPGGRLSVSVPKMRAVVAEPAAPAARALFTYLGPSAETAPLGSGEIRRQFGLKLRAQDGCNLVYVMWRIEPESKLVVSVKSNPGMRTSAQCGNRGYRNVKALHSSPVPALTPGASHSVDAEMDGEEMKVRVDGALVWEGRVGPEALSFRGPVGVRTDNGRFEFELDAGEPAPGETSAATPCRERSGEVD